jgi:deoxycytidylate deaminase
MVPCLKQKTRCVIVFPDGARYEATNECAVGGLDVCPRVTAGSKTGEDYELCGSTHAEANAAGEVPWGKEGGAAYLFGHDWFCGPCQHALQNVGVRTFTVTSEPA